MDKLVTSEKIRNFESDLIKKSDSNMSITLMEKAGLGLANILKEYKEPYLFVCGKGNNGGDGLVASRYLFEYGKNVSVVLTCSESSLSREAKTNLNLIKNKISYSTLESIDDTGFSDLLNASNTVIDCLLGTGRKNKLSELYEWLIKMINNSHKTVIACDIPTGVDPDTGNVLDTAIKAEATITFSYPKVGLVIYPGKKYAGEIKIVDIGLGEIDTNHFLLDDKFLKDNFPKRLSDANKGSFGRTLLVSGSKKYPGAALLASKGAASIGSGLTSLASTDDVFSKITAITPEVTHVDFNLSTILEESMKSSVLVIGPGLTMQDEIKTLVESLITNANVPIVLDADGINALEGKKDVIKKVKKEIILTPHPKEFARLLGINVDEVLNNKLELAKTSASELGCTVVLKGPGTIIATKEGMIYISPFANSALAKGGTGDVLAGFIGGLIAQGLKPSLAACVGVYIHGKTAELIAHDKTVFSLFPQDLITYLPSAIKTFIS